MYISTNYDYFGKPNGYWVMDSLGSIHKKPIKSLAKAKALLKRAEKAKEQKQSNPSILKKLRHGVRGFIKVSRGRLIIKT